MTSHTDIVSRIMHRGIIWAFILTLIVASSTNAYNALAKGYGWAVFAVVIVLVEALGAVLAERFFHARRWGYGSAAVVLWTIAMTASLVQSFNSAAMSQDGQAANRLSLHASQEAKKSARDIAAENVTAAKEKREGLRKQVWAPLPTIDGVAVNSAAAAEEAIAKAKAHRFWRVTAECAETKGPDTRKFCASYREATAAVAELSKREELRKEFSAAEKAYDEAHRRYTLSTSEALATPVVTGQKTAFVIYAARLTGIDPDTVELAAATQMSITAQVFLTILGLFVFGSAAVLDRPAPGASGGMASLMPSGPTHTRTIAPVAMRFDEFEKAFADLNARGAAA